MYVKNLRNHEVCSLREYFLKIAMDMHKDVVKVEKGLSPLSLVKENWLASDRMAVALVGPDADTASFIMVTVRGSLRGY